MNGLLRLVVCSTFLVACSVSAFADSVSVSGNLSFDQTNLTFAPPFSTGGDTGSLAGFSGGTVQYYLGTVQYNNFINAPELAFSIVSSTAGLLQFYDQVNTAKDSYDSKGNLVVTLDESGFYLLNGASYAGFFDLTLNGTSANGAAQNVGFLGSGALTDPPPVVSSTGVAPEPTSILLMGTGFLSMAVLLRSRTRRRAGTLS